MASTTYEYILELKDKMSKTMQKVGGKSAKVYAGLQRQQKRLNKLTAKFAPISNKVFAAVGVASVGMFAKSVVSSTMRMAEMGDEAAKTGRQLGMSAEALQEYRFAADRQGVSASELQTSFEGLSRRIGELRTGTGTLNSYLQKSGQQGFAEQLKAAKNTDEAFEMIVRQLNKLKDPADKANFAMQAFGRSGMGMVKMTEAGVDGIRALRDEKRKYGIMSNEAAAKSEQFLDMQTNLKSTIEGIKISVATELMPVIMGFMKQLQGWFNANKQIIAQNIGSFVKRLAGFVGFLADNMNIIVPVLKIVIGLLVALKAATIALNIAMMTNPIGWITGLIALLVIGIIALIRNFDTVKAAMRGTWEVVKSLGEIIKIYLITPYKLLGQLIVGVGKTMWYVMTGQFRKAIQEGKDTFAGLKDTVVKESQSIVSKATGLGRDFQRGFNKGAKQEQKQAGITNPLGGTFGTFKGAQASEATGVDSAGMVDEMGAESATAITTGGKKQTNINITLDSLVKGLNISGGDFSENARQMEQKVTEAMLRVLNSANTVNG